MRVMNKFLTFLAVLAISVTGTLTNPTESYAPLAIDCEWAKWGPCKDIKCGIGRKVLKIFHSVQLKSVFSHFYCYLTN